MRKKHFLLLLYTILSICIPDAESTARELEVDYDIRFFLQYGETEAIGTQKVRIVNHGEKELTHLLFFLYPNIFSKPGDMQSIQDNYPKGFKEGKIEILSITTQKTNIYKSPEDEMHFQYADNPANSLDDNNLISVSLPFLLAPGDSINLEISFKTTIPERFGTFSYTSANSGQYTLQGGWHPYLANYSNGRWIPTADPHPANFKVELIIPAKNDISLVSTGEILQRRIKYGYEHIYLSKKNSKIFSIILGRLSKETHHYRGIDINLYLITSQKNKKRTKKIIGIIKDTLDYFESRYMKPKTKELNFVESYISADLFALGADMLIISNRLYQVFPYLKKYHDQRLINGIMTYLWSTISEDEKWILEGLAYADTTALLADMKSASLEKHLRKFSFLPVIDNILYSKTIPMRNAYFKGEKIDKSREDIFYFNNSRPHGSIIFQKINHLIGKEKFKKIYQDLPEHVKSGTGFELLLNRERDITWYYSQWTSKNPEVDYKINILKALRQKFRQKEKYKTEIEIEKSIQIFEPVNINIYFRNKRKISAHWDGMTETKTISTFSDTPVIKVEVDPEGFTNDINRHNNSIPAKWKVLLEDFSTKYDIQTKKLEYKLGLSFQPVYKTRDIFRLKLKSTQEAVGASTSYTYIYKTPLMPKIKQSLSTSISIDRSNINIGGEKKNLKGNIGIAHTVGSIRFPIYPDMIQRMIEGIFPFSSLRTEYSQQFTGNKHPFSLRFILDARKYFQFANRKKLALKLSIGESLNNSKDEVFFLGGSDGIRGYTKLAFIGENILLLSAEYRFTLIDIIEREIKPVGFVHSLKGIIFTDMGTVNNNRKKIFNQRRFKRDYGVGINCKIDLFGIYPTLVRFDIAKPVNPEIKKENKPHYYISIGNPF